MTREEAIKYIQEWLKDKYALNDRDRIVLQMAIEALSADAVQGEWVEVEVFPEVYDIEGVKSWGSEMQCDQCGFRHTAIEGHMAQYNFCPNCGARMEGGEE